MANKCKDDQVRRDGTGQGQRFLPALDTSRNFIDDRKPEDLLVFAKHYAELVRFYDADKPVDLEDHSSKQSEKDDEEGTLKPNENWKEFFTKDITTVIASIAQYKNRLDWLRQEFDDKRKKSDNRPTPENFRGLFITIINHFARFNKWYSRSIPDHPLKNEIEVKIHSTLKPALEKLISYGRGYSVLNEGKLGLRNYYSDFKEYPWNIKYDDIKGNDDIYTGINRQKKISNAALFVDDIFLIVLKTYKELTDRTNFYFTYSFENYPQHKPHMALFIAFIELFGYAQKELNSITRRHLEFYYRDVLHLHERPANPDAVYLIYELAKEAIEYDLKKGTPLTAGKDGFGKEMIYKTETDLVINKAKVKELKTIFLDKNTEGKTPEEREQIRRIYSSPVANSEDGNGAPFKIPETAWPALGYFNTKTPRNNFKQNAEIGFAIASPQLLLAEGERKITITINEAGFDLTSLSDALEIYLTTEKEWLLINEIKSDGVPIRPTIYSIVDNTIIVDIQSSEPAIAGYDNKLHGGEYNTTYPIIKFVIDSSRYDLFKSIQTNPTLIKISVEVHDVTNLTLSNDDSPIDHTKSFNPFTLLPKPNSGFFVGNKEVFSKKLKWVRLELDRKLKDKQVISELFKAPFGIDSLVVEVDALFQKEWFPLLFAGAKDVALWVKNDGSDSGPGLEIDVDGSLNSDSFKRIVRDQITDSNAETFQRKLRFSLHYFESDKNSDAKITNILFPSEKFTSFSLFQLLALLLELNAIKLSYYSEQGFEQGVEQFFHIYPFGNVEIEFPIVGIDINHIAPEFLTEEDNIPVYTNYLLPQYKFGFQNVNFIREDQYLSSVYQQGNLYIGIEDLVLPQNISLLFKIADGTAEDNDEEPPKINWSYLIHNKWRLLKHENIISDSTYGLQATGIVLIDFPKDATTNNTIITKGLHWLCASVDNEADKIPKIIDIIAQANKAIFFDQENDPEHYRNPLPAKTIAKLVTKVPEVKLITQPFESFDRKMREEGNVFYARASERLRHKHRAITPWDYEHLVLQHFPWIYKVKCLSNTDPVCLCRHEEGDETKCCCEQIAPGHVLIIPVSNLRNKNAVDILKPRTGRRTLIQIEEYLRKLTSPFVHVRAKNPLFEEIKTSFKVKFHTGTDKGRYLRQLNDDIIKYLTPWAFDETKDVIFGGKVYASNIINFIEELDYVDYITCFRMIHIINDCCEKITSGDILCSDLQRVDHTDSDVDKVITDRFKTEIQASSSRAILTSAKKHCIELIDEPKNNDECNCS
ncbi:MAG TPA: hypothetical protein VIU35_18450 [Chitinophagaceae bacterium]